MILPNTSVLLYVFASGSAFHQWAKKTIADVVAGEGAVINAVRLAEICVGDEDPVAGADRIRSWDAAILDVPAAAADVCAAAYCKYRKRMISQTDAPVPIMPLFDFFVGAHAKLWAGKLLLQIEADFRDRFIPLP